MSFNLIEARWLPCRRASGGRAWCAPHEITFRFDDDPILALDFPRADWSAAVTELLIGLLSATMPPEDADDWAASWVTPPQPSALQDALAPLAFAFDLDGDGPRCFQDIDPLGAAEPKSIASLLIDAPGDNTVRENKDLFVKRGGVTALSLPYVAAALATLQTYAPAGGQGNRTSMRGGGPLTVLVTPRRRHPNGAIITTLWDAVWSNVREAEEDVPPLSAALPREHKRWARVFPWLAATRTSQNANATLPEEHADPLQAYFGMPRRIRLDIPVKHDGDNQCSLGGLAEFGIVQTYRATNYGIMYSGWRHPLSPYYVDKSNGLLPFHPQPGLVTYADWLAWWGLRDGNPALNLKLWPERLTALGQTIDLSETRQHGLHAFGFDMDNMEPRGWLDERIPYFEPPNDQPIWAERYQASVTLLIAGAKAAADQLKYELRRSLYSKWDGKQFKLLDNTPKSAFETEAAQFWRETQGAFVQSLIDLHSCDPADRDRTIRLGFLKQLRRTALRLFDDASNIDSLADQNTRRLIEARKGLVSAASDDGKVAVEMQLVAQKPRKSGGKRGATP